MTQTGNMQSQYHGGSSGYPGQDGGGFSNHYPGSDGPSEYARGHNSHSGHDGDGHGGGDAIACGGSNGGASSGSNPGTGAGSDGGAGSTSPGQTGGGTSRRTLGQAVGTTAGRPAPTVVAALRQIMAAEAAPAAAPMVVTPGTEVAILETAAGAWLATVRGMGIRLGMRPRS